MPQYDTTDFWIVLAIGLVLIAVSLLILKKLIFKMFKSDSPSVTETPDPVQQSTTEPMNDTTPRCITCKEPVATEASPIAERSRGTMIRDHLSMPPHYRRVVPKTGAKVFCRHHAHVADARLVEFIDKSIRGAFSEAYAKAAIDIARFEQEGLFEAVAESLTDSQKKADAQRKSQKKTGTVTQLVRVGNGTDTTTSAN